MGGDALISGHKAPIPRTGYECFQSPVPGDIVANGRKLAGAAQRRSKWGLLHQGAIAVKLSAQQLGKGFHQVLSVEFQPYEMPTELLAVAQRLASEKYATDAWNKRFA